MCCEVSGLPGRNLTTLIGPLPNPSYLEQIADNEKPLGLRGSS